MHSNCDKNPDPRINVERSEIQSIIGQVGTLHQNFNTGKSDSEYDYWLDPPIIGVNIDREELEDKIRNWTKLCGSMKSRQGHLLRISGPGSSGKTTLAIKATAKFGKSIWISRKDRQEKVEVLVRQVQRILKSTERKVIVVFDDVETDHELKKFDFVPWVIVTSRRRNVGETESPRKVTPLEVTGLTENECRRLIKKILEPPEFDKLTENDVEKLLKLCKDSHNYPLTVNIIGSLMKKEFDIFEADRSDYLDKLTSTINGLKTKWKNSKTQPTETDYEYDNTCAAIDVSIGRLDHREMNLYQKLVLFLRGERIRCSTVSIICEKNESETDELLSEFHSVHLLDEVRYNKRLKQHEYVIHDLVYLVLHNRIDYGKVKQLKVEAIHKFQNLSIQSLSECNESFFTRFVSWCLDADQIDAAKRQMSNLRYLYQRLRFSYVDRLQLDFDELIERCQQDQVLVSYRDAAIDSLAKEGEACENLLQTALLRPHEDNLYQNAKNMVLEGGTQSKMYLTYQQSPKVHKGEELRVRSQRVLRNLPAIDWSNLSVDIDNDGNIIIGMGQQVAFFSKHEEEMIASTACQGEVKLVRFIDKAAMRCMVMTKDTNGRIHWFVYEIEPLKREMKLEAKDESNPVHESVQSATEIQYDSGYLWIRSTDNKLLCHSIPNGRLVKKFDIKPELCRLVVGHDGHIAALSPENQSNNTAIMQSSQPSSSSVCLCCFGFPWSNRNPQYAELFSVDRQQSKQLDLAGVAVGIFPSSSSSVSANVLLWRPDEDPHGYHGFLHLVTDPTGKLAGDLIIKKLDNCPRLPINMSSHFLYEEKQFFNIYNTEYNIFQFCCYSMSGEVQTYWFKIDIIIFVMKDVMQFHFYKDKIFALRANGDKIAMYSFLDKPTEEAQPFFNNVMQSRYTDVLCIRWMPSLTDFVAVVQDIKTDEACTKLVSIQILKNELQNLPIKDHGMTGTPAVNICPQSVCVALAFPGQILEFKATTGQLLRKLSFEGSGNLVAVCYSQTELLIDDGGSVYIFSEDDVEAKRFNVPNIKEANSQRSSLHTKEYFRTVPRVEAWKETILRVETLTHKDLPFLRSYHITAWHLKALGDVVDLERWAAGFAISDDRRFIVMVTSDGVICLWDLDTLEETIFPKVTMQNPTSIGTTREHIQKRIQEIGYKKYKKSIEGVDLEDFPRWWFEALFSSCGCKVAFKFESACGEYERKRRNWRGIFVAVQGNDRTQNWQIIKVLEEEVEVSGLWRAAFVYLHPEEHFILINSNKGFLTINYEDSSRVKVTTVLDRINFGNNNMNIIFPNICISPSAEYVVLYDQFFVYSIAVRFLMNRSIKISPKSG